MSKSELTLKMVLDCRDAMDAAKIPHQGRRVYDPKTGKVVTVDVALANNRFARMNYLRLRGNR